MTYKQEYEKAKRAYFNEIAEADLYDLSYLPALQKFYAVSSKLAMDEYEKHVQSLVSLYGKETSNGR